MPILMYYLPSNPRSRYWTYSLNDPNIPSGYVYSEGSDGATPEALQVYVAGQVSGGYPAYGDLSLVSNQKYPNGILNS